MVRLTNQLLAYARGGKYQAKSMSLSDFVGDTLPLIRHSIDPATQIDTDLPDDIWSITSDTTQMQMLLFAVLQNASEAIEETGRIKISVRNIEVENDSDKEHPDLTPGSHVCLTVQDDGKGMDEATRNRIFDPFFTTKFHGRGLSMAAVYGIVQNHDGIISVTSELNRGTTVRIYLPAFREQLEKSPVRIDKPVKGTETILIVEDEEMVMEVNRKILERLNYRVIGAHTGSEAVKIAQTFDGDIDLALLDLGLPDKGGNEIYPLLMKARPNLKVIVCSGHSLDSPAQEIIDAGAQDFIQKPFTVDTLSAKLNKVLSS
jgi:CheY-like chemotaxis protein